MRTYRTSRSGQSVSLFALFSCLFDSSGKNFVLKIMREAAVGAVGLPLSVQVVTRPYQEEQCLAVMKLVEDVWKKN